MRLRLSGELDIATAPVIEERLLQAEQDATPEILVDLENVTFMDSSGIHAFKRAADRASVTGREFGLVKAPEVVLRLLQITGTSSLLGPDQSAADW
jgi:anti-anti-sigma factor